MAKQIHLLFVLFLLFPLINTQAQTSCIDGKAGEYDCDAVELLSVMSITDLGGDRRVEANDIWGWTDPASGKEYALIGLTDATAFVDISEPTRPVYLGSLDTHTNSNVWRDVKVYKNHAYIVADNVGSHGMQIFDLTQLANVTSPPTTFQATAHHDGFGSAHNVVINEDSGFAYAVGSSQCAGGLYMMDISTPTQPAFAGCFSGDGYTHDAQCVNYSGPDADYQGREICVNSNEDTITVVDVTDKQNPVQISRQGYPNSEYVHQGWFTDDQQYFYQNDELDEKGDNTRTIIWDMKDLDDPFVADEYFGETKAIDHNLYVKGNFVYEANYTAGLRILDISSPEKPVEVAFFDTYTPNNATSFNGAWSSYPFFESGIVIVSSIEDGLFVIKPDLEHLPVELAGFEALVSNGEVILKWQTLSETNNAGFEVEQQVNGGFQYVGYIEGKGTTTETQSYQFGVENLSPGRHAFRLKQIDFDGTFEYSEVVYAEIDAPAELAIEKVFPNPFNPTSMISLSVARAQAVRVEAFNYQGQRVAVLFNGQMDANVAHDVRFDATNLPSGAYIIRATGDHEVVTRTVTLVK